MKRMNIDEMIESYNTDREYSQIIYTILKNIHDHPQQSVVGVTVERDVQSAITEDNRQVTIATGSCRVLITSTFNASGQIPITLETRFHVDMENGVIFPAQWNDD